MKRWRIDPGALRDAAVLLPVAAAILLLPPFILIFAVPVAIDGGIPLIVVYVYGAWGAVVTGAWFIARAHAPASRGGASADDADQL